MVSQLPARREPILSDLSTKALNSVALQAEMFRRAKEEHGLSITVLMGRTTVSDTTLRGWARGEHQMPAWALGELGIPVHLTSLVLDPWQRHVGENEHGEADYDDAGLAASDVSSAVQRARHPNSPGGVAIVHTEKLEIARAAQRACPKLRAVAA